MPFFLAISAGIYRQDSGAAGHNRLAQSHCSTAESAVMADAFARCGRFCGRSVGDAPVLTQLVQAEATDRATRSIRYQMHVVRLPMHRDLAGFDFEQEVDRRQSLGFATTTCTEQAENLVLIGGPPIAPLSIRRSTSTLRK